MLVLESDPNNIGANHYNIHFIESTAHPSDALQSADRFNALLVPGSEHLVHMPAHIYFLTRSLSPSHAFWMVYLLGYSFKLTWVYFYGLLFLLITLIWFLVVYLQVKMSQCATLANQTNMSLPLRYHVYYRYWLLLGLIGFTVLIIIFYLMTNKPC